jgi:hypothetical protein
MQRRVTTVLSALILIATTSGAQAQDPSWISLDGISDPGTPAVLVLDVGASDDQNTFLELTIPGFWVTPTVGADAQTYQKLDFPGLGIIGLLGAPQLPQIRFDLAIPTAASELLLESFEPLDVQYLAGFNVWPQETPGRDDEDPIPPIFQRDDMLYAGSGFWPPELAPATSPTATKLLTVPSASFTLNPCRWDPETAELEVLAALRIQLHHGGAPQGFEEMTKDRARVCSHQFLNWPSVRDHFPVNQLKLEANYLIICPQAYETTLGPLIKQKKARGYNVTIQHLEQMAATCYSIHQAIVQWSSTSPASNDYYVLLVGDTDVLPQCDSPVIQSTASYPSDDPYAAAQSNNLDDEFWVGRLSVDSATDLANQVKKILSYENGIHPQGGYGNACLVASKAAGGVNYSSAFATRSWSSFASAPSFTEHRGSAGATNAILKSSIASGVGLLVYRGIAIEPSWQCWNSGCEYFDWQDIDDILNIDRAPVVWSIGPRMGDLSYNSNVGGYDCLGETWLEEPNGGAVAHYGARAMPNTLDSNVLLDQLMSFVYDKGVTNHAQAIALAEQKMAKLKSADNAWLYGLLGDPDMMIRRQTPWSWNIQSPAVLSICDIAPCTFQLRVTDSGMHPISDLLVSAWKPGDGEAATKRGTALLQGPDEVHDNRYTDADGWVSIPASPSSEGWMHFVIRDAEGNAHVGSVEIRHGTAAPATRETSLYLRAQPSVMESRTTFHFGGVLPVAAELTIYDVRGRSLRQLAIDAGRSEATWDGRDRRGVQVASGNYIASMAVQGRRFTTRLVKLN